MAAFFNLTGALTGTAVASTIGKGIVDLHVVTMPTILCALIGAIVWNLITWMLGLPSSSSHALIGGLCGAAVASARGDWSVLKWQSGLMPKVVIPMITSPIVGFLVGGLLMVLLLIAFRSFTPHLDSLDFWQTPAGQRRLDGPQPWDKRRAKDDGYHRARSLHRDDQREIRRLASAL